MSCGDNCMCICISSKLFSVATGVARPARPTLINPHSHRAKNSCGKVGENCWFFKQICCELCRCAFVSQNCISYRSCCIHQALTCMFRPFFDVLDMLFARVQINFREPVPDLRLNHTGTRELRSRHGLFFRCSYLRGTRESLSCSD